MESDTPQSLLGSYFERLQDEGKIFLFCFFSLVLCFVTQMFANTRVLTEFNKFVFIYALASKIFKQ